MDKQDKKNIMEDSGIDSGDGKPICDISASLTPKRGIGGVPASRIMQRKLGPRNRNKESKKCSGSLLPLQRLPVPGARENQPLVAWDTDESEEEVVSFFPPPRRSPCGERGGGAPAGGPGCAGPDGAQEPSDSLSVEELSITDEEDEGDDLELVLPPGSEGTSGSLLCCGARFCCLL